MDQGLPFLLISLLIAASVTTHPLICAVSSGLQSFSLIHSAGFEDTWDLSGAPELSCSLVGLSGALSVQCPLVWAGLVPYWNTGRETEKQKGDVRQGYVPPEVVAMLKGRSSICLSVCPSGASHGGWCQGGTCQVWS